MTRHAVGGRGVLAALALGMALIAAGTVGLVLARGGPVAGPPLARVPAPDGPAAGVPWPAAAGQAAAPVRLTIPAIGVRTRLIRLGLTKAGTLQLAGNNP